VDGTDWRYLSLARELAAATRTLCGPACAHPHAQESALHINALLGNHLLIHKLLQVAANFEKNPPPSIDELKQSLWRLEARRRSRWDGFSANPSSDSSSTEQEQQ
jgi:hypothetical protein